jgi:hypothetical protein
VIHSLLFSFLVAETNAAREERRLLLEKTKVAVFVQSHWRSKRTRDKERDRVSAEWECATTFATKPVVSLR